MGLVLDLFSGTGSATQPFVECGRHRVIRIDIAGKPDIRADVRHLPLDPGLRPEFVWASPPCPLYSYVRTYNKHTGEKYAYAPDLSCWQAVPTDGFYVIENVLGAQRSWGKPTYRFGPWCLWTNLELGFVGKVPGKSKLIWDPKHPTTRRTAVIPRAIAEAVHLAVCDSALARKE